jgi:protein-disulfide isomerase
MAIILQTIRAQLMTLAIVAPLAFGALDASAGPCKAPTPDKQANIDAFVRKHYNLSSTATVSLLDSSQANDACYWRLHYSVSTLSTSPTVYLSPDGLYLMYTLMDLSIDPLVERKLKAEKLTKVLLSNGPPSHGRLDAPITIVEFTDFQCPYCKQFMSIFDNDLTADERNSVRLVFRNYPLAMHPWAKDAAEIAGCAALQSDASFWKVHDYLFSNQASLTAQNLREQVVNFAIDKGGVDATQLHLCLDKRLAVGGVTQDEQMGNENGVHATPTLFINGTKYEGMRDATQLRVIISDILQAQEAQSKSPAPQGSK